MCFVLPTKATGFGDNENLSLFDLLDMTTTFCYVLPERAQHIDVAKSNNGAGVDVRKEQAAAK